ncbi:hypothetical protein CH063_09477, partial [Colletotrichum higginsianum]
DTIPRLLDPGLSPIILILANPACHITVDVDRGRGRHIPPPCQSRPCQAFPFKRRTSASQGRLSIMASEGGGYKPIHMERGREGLGLTCVPR